MTFEAPPVPPPPAAPVEPPHLSDVGNARRLVADHGRDLRYAPGIGWLAWDRRRFRRDTGGEVMERAKRSVAAIYAEAERCTDSADRKQLVRHALGSESASRIRAMVELAQTDPTVVVDPVHLDADPWVLNTPGGLVDLHTGEVGHHDRAALCTKITTVTPDFDRTGERWEPFLTRALPDEVRQYVQRAAGYSISGDVSEHALFLNHGGGGNGKSVFTETVRGSLGDYAATVPGDLLLARRSDSHPAVMATLHGVRLAVVAETPEGARLAEPRVKSLTGGDTVTARKMYGHYFEFEPTAHLWCHTNHRPTIKGTDNGIWRRIRLVPWTTTIPEPEQDPRLLAALVDEHPAVLAWLIAGCRSWQADGLRTPATVTTATDRYRSDSDHLTGFLDEATAGIDTASVSAEDLHRAYSAWCGTNGEKALSGRALGLALAERGLQNRRLGPARRWHWLGLALLVPAEVTSP